MTTEKLAEYIQNGEGIDVEFKSAQNGVPENLYETICAFLNRNGGHIFLGVDDDRNIIGLNPSKIDNYIQQILTTSNNSTKISPAFFLLPEKMEYQNKLLIYLYVPESSQVHSTSGKIFDRSNDSDFDITKNNTLVTTLYQKKQQTFTENKIYPYMELSDLRSDLLARVRRMAGNHRLNHPWPEMSDLELMKSAGLYQKDFVTGQEGFTMAAALLVGKDDVIRSILPAYKTDAIVRVQNLDRYDDRDDIRTNLIESYDRLMAFIEKHLSDKFYEEPNAQRRSLRSVIFHEVIVNLLGHREFTNPFPAKLIIEADRVRTENWCKPHGFGNIEPGSFTPQTKNPNIARFFREIGRFEELGSGVRNIFNYTRFYSNGQKPELLEGDIFKTIIPIFEINRDKAIELVKISGEEKDTVNDTVNDTVSDTVSDIVNATYGKLVSNVVKERMCKIIDLVSNNPGCKMVDLENDIKISTRVLNENISYLVNSKLIIYSGSKKNGGYYITENLKERIKK